MDVTVKLRAGIQHHQAGRLEAAMAVYEQILRRFPEHSDALHLSGLIVHQRGDSDDAIMRIRRAVKQHPDKIAYRKNLCLILSAAGRVSDAIRCCAQLINDFPGSIDILALLGNLHMRQKDYPAAVDCYLKAIQIEPKNADFRHNLGVAYQEMGRMEEALSHYRQAIRLKPDLAEAYYNLGNALRMQTGINEAVIAAYHSALDIKSDYTDASFNLAKAYDEMEKTDEAIHCYRQTLRLAPDFVDGHSCLGNAYLKQGDYQSAFGCYEQAIRIDPHFYQGYYNLALTCKLQGKLSQAVTFVKHSLKLNPGDGKATSLLVQILQQACLWPDLQEADNRLDAITEKELNAHECPSEQPFLNFTRRADPALNLRIASAWSNDTAARAVPMGGAFVHGQRDPRDGKIVIGYVSERFRNAATAHLMLQLFALHDRRRFKVHAYSFGKDDGSNYRKRIAQDVDLFIDIRHMSDAEAARCIHEDGVDILIDLMGFMKHNRMAIFAFRPAPVQVAYLGYPSTTGAEFMDYLIADPIVAPAGEDRFYSEYLVRLPHCYQINDNTQTVSAQKFTREACGLPENAFVYCSFNTDYKIDRKTFQAWMRILGKVPQSVLWLLVRSPETQQNLIAAAGTSGISADRLVFAQSLPKPEHLARLRLADLALDTRIVNGHTTTSDCLWVDLPVVALKGNHFASRVSASLLLAVGLPEMVCSSLQEYESLAVDLSSNQRRFSEIRSRLVTNKFTEPLFDTSKTVRSLESAYAQMWECYTKSRHPQPFTVRID